jgi:hypothetical protein
MPAGTAANRGDQTNSTITPHQPPIPAKTTNQRGNMSTAITIDYPIKTGDQVALVRTTPIKIQAGSTLLFSIDGKPAKLVAKDDTPVGWLNVEIEPYKGDFEIPANSRALVFPPESGIRILIH